MIASIWMHWSEYFSISFEWAHGDHIVSDIKFETNIIQCFFRLFIIGETALFIQLETTIDARLNCIIV